MSFIVPAALPDRQYPDDPGSGRDRQRTTCAVTVIDVSESSDYYLRLEQGRDRNPSSQVLEALARVLRLELAGQFGVSIMRPLPPAALAHILEPADLDA
jgi:transcriptional regulator with XRE-family HTH domain